MRRKKKQIIHSQRRVFVYFHKLMRIPLQMPHVSEAVEIGSYLRSYLHIVFETDHRHAGEPCEKAGTYHLIGNVKDVRKNDARQPRMTEKGDALVVWLHRLIKASVVSAVAVPLDQTVHPVGHVLKAEIKPFSESPGQAVREDSMLMALFSCEASSVVGTIKIFFILPSG